MSDRLQNAVAIIGVAGRFPGADNVEHFWKNLCAGRESISSIPEQELEDRLTPAQRSQGKYIAARALLKDVDLFDADFFHFLPREAELTDPQQRILMECAWEAFEDAGYDPARVPGNVGVFAGSSINTYLLLHLASDAKFREEFTRSYQVGSFPALVGNGQDFLATRISYKLNLRGPAMTVQSACSTSLLAVAQAWQSLVNYQADLALAGGVSISFPQSRGYFYQDGGMVSLDGHCRPFDKSAGGTVFGAGAGMVLLKRADEAIADGDHIYALLLGAGVNNDGSDKIGYAAPSCKGQADAISMAYAVAGVSSSSIGYVECHGTGTPLGDPIEITALAQAFADGEDRKFPCRISSVKGNVGHLDVAAGVTGLIKAALCLDREKIPGTLHFTAPNSQLALEKTPFSITSESTEWLRCSAVRRAGVSAFGVGGTNVHVVLEEAPLAAMQPALRPKQLLCLSARTPKALEAQCLRLAQHLDEADAKTFSLPDVAYTLATGRRDFAHRLAVSVESKEEAVSQLRQPHAIRNRFDVSGSSARVAMLFPGQGSQYPGMGQDLYNTESKYRQIVDECCQQLQSMVGIDLLSVMYPKALDDTAVHALEQTRYAQPALFVCSYALARLWMHWGVQPDCMVGHSVGELTAACLAGIFSLEDALLFVARRGEWMQELPTGSMLAVRMQPKQLQSILSPALSVAAINAPSLCVVSGPTEEIETLAADLEKNKIVSRLLHTSHAFHSSMVEPVVERLLQLLEQITLHGPQSKIISTVTGEELTQAQAMSPEYWANHCRAPVCFSAATQTLLHQGYEVLLEVGVGETLTTLVRQQLPTEGKTVICATLPSNNSQKTSWDVVTESVGEVWTRGVQVNWNAYYDNENRRRVSLPTYPFERKRYWIEGQVDSSQFSKPVYSVATQRLLEETLDDAGNKPLLETLENTMTEIASPLENSMKLDDRAARLCQEVSAILEDLSGIALAVEHYDVSFLELGFDSLFLTQAAQKFQTLYQVKIAFRQLLDALGTIRLVANYLDQQMAPEASKQKPDTPETVLPPQDALGKTASQTDGEDLTVSLPSVERPMDGSIASLMQQQLQAMSQLIQSQLQILSQSNSTDKIEVVTAQHATQASAQVPLSTSSVPKPSSERATEKRTEGHVLHKNPIQSSKGGMTPEQQIFLAQLIERYCRKTAKSKSFTQKHRRTLADPRVVSGFRPEWKEMVYSIVSSRSKGSKLWDIDGNEYVDLVNGFGPNMFGHAPEFVTNALHRQMSEGFAIGPQTPLAGKAADLLTQMTGTDRVTFCNTGSEAVMAAMRIARTVTGRDRVVFFAGDYHGQFDEVLVKQLKRKGVFTVQPAAPGIPRASLDSVTVLDYGTDESLRYIEQHANELAAVLIEPVQSRHPQLQPEEFLKRVREITRQSGTAFIFDEVVTGFRIHPRGAQGYYGIDADLVTYGKVVGGGMPIGILAGKAAFMDALDGGYWEFGDASVPEAGVTFFAGTFVRHPLTMAALCATLEHIRDTGESAYTSLNQRARHFAAQLNDVFQDCGVPFHLEQCGSVMYFGIPSEVRFGGLLYYLLREKGVFILEGFPLYLTTEHNDADLNCILQAFRQSISELQSCGLMPRAAATLAKPLAASALSIIVPDVTTDVPLTEPQLEIILAAQVSDEANCAFNESFSLHLDGPLHADVLQSAWKSLLLRHDALCMSLTAAGDTLHFDRQRVVPIERIDLNGRSSETQQKLLADLIEAEGTQPFDLVRGPLLRAKLIALAAEQAVLIVTAHHLICDGWSANVIGEELGEMYSAEVRGVSAELPPTISFSQYAVDCESASARERQIRDLEYWKQHLTPQPELLSLPTEHSRPAMRGFAGDTFVTEFPKDFVTSLRKTGASVGCTLFTTLLAGWQIFLWRLSGNSDPVTMIPAAAQSQMEGKVLVGHCVHLLPIRASLTADMTASDYLCALKSVVLDAYEHQSATYGNIVRETCPSREPGRLPLSEIQFNLEQMGRRTSFHLLKTEIRANGKKAVNFDLFLNIVDTGNGLRLECDYNTALYSRSTISCWLSCYRSLLEGMIANQAQTVARLPLLDAGLRMHLLESCNATASGPMPAENVHALIDTALAAMPIQPAAECYGLELTREELTEQSDRLAAWLIRHGAREGSLVGIYMDRSLEMLIAMLGVMKTGAAYVPLDPTFPLVRIEQIVDETKVPILLTLARHLDALPKSNAKVIALDAESAVLANEPRVKLPVVSSDARAYVIFTSGSTGLPKGVEVTHGSIVNLLTDVAQRVEIGQKDRLLAVTTFSFDIAVLEMLLPLLSGGTVVIAHRDDVLDASRLMELLKATRATVLQATPITWRMLLERGFRCEPGFKMLCGGEAWAPAIAGRLLTSGGRLWNMYGPTETTVWSSVTEVERDASRITIGPPIANTRFYVLDGRLQPVPPGVPGELFIAGAGVARGYFERPELTAEKFLLDPFVPTQRMYRTGDEVRQLQDGSIEFLARLDHQIKLHGFRIELGDIETAIRALPEVKDAVAILRQDTIGEAILVAYYTGGEGHNPAALRQMLRNRLPEYMLPTVLVPIESLPLTPNGKVDRRALPDPSWQTEVSQEACIEPTTPTEKALSEIVCEVLGCERISATASLLDHGADSLRIFQIAARAHRSGLAVSARQLMQLRTIQSIAEALDATHEIRPISQGPGNTLHRISRENYRVTA